MYGLQTTNGFVQVKMSMNPFCEIAVEEGIRLKEGGLASEVVAVSIGPKQSVETLRSALATGADRAIHVTTDLRLDQELQPLATAKLLKAIVDIEKPDLVILGKQSIDGDNGTTGPMLAELLDWPQVTFASKLDLIDDNTAAVVERETDVGVETVQVPLPALVTADLRLNTPRYPKLPSIMKAKKKPIETHDAAALGVDLELKNVVVSVDAPPPRPPGVKVASVDELVDKLKNEASVL